MFASILFLSFGSALAFADTPPATTAAATETTTTEQTVPSNQRITCRSRPRLGSRIARTRICKTQEEWRIYEDDLEASRRDINDRGARGCDMELSDEC
jgi:hypothetical protein